MGQRWTKARKRVLEDSRIGLTRRQVVWLATRLQRPQLLVSASAIGYGADAPGSLDEESAPGSDYAAQLCQRWEIAARAAGHAIGHAGGARGGGRQRYEDAELGAYR